MCCLIRLIGTDLGTQKKKVDKAVAEDKEKEAAKANTALNVPQELLLAIHEKTNEEPVPTSPEERHDFFVNVVGAAEKLAAQGVFPDFDAVPTF